MKQTVAILQSQTMVYISAVLALFAVSLMVPLAASAATPKAPDPTTGYLLLYSQGGKFKKATISTNDSTKKAKCGAKKFYDGKGAYKDITVGLASGNKTKSGRVIATKLKCSGGTYSVKFFKKSATKDSGTASVTLPAGKCSFVHNYGVTRDETIVNDRCTGDDDQNTDNIQKTTPTLTASVDANGVITQGKKVTITYELKDPSGNGLSYEECLGSLKLGGSSAFAATQNQPVKLRFNPTTKTCQHRKVIASGITKKATVGSFTQTATFDGNKFLNAAAVGYPYTIVADPAKQATAASAKPTGPISIASERITKDSKNKYSVTTKVTVKNFANCVDNAPGVSVTAFKYKKETGDKPHDIESSKKPKQVSVKAAKAGKNCNFTIMHTYPSAAKKMDVKHQFSITVEGKTYSKKTNKIEIGV